MRRDPFARSEVERQTVTDTSCQWCGQRRRRAFRYRRVDDSLACRFVPWSRPFCNLQCADAYYGEKI